MPYTDFNNQTSQNRPVNYEPFRRPPCYPDADRFSTSIGPIRIPKK